jgi:hypothetical protein
VLIEPLHPTRLQANWRVSCSCEGSLSVSDLRPEFVNAGLAGQFVQGLYCDRCAIGYLPDHMAKPLAPAYKLDNDGWRRVYEDGTVGPLLERMSDDPDSEIA